jgi:hypothetical protein
MDVADSCRCCGRPRTWADDPSYDGNWEQWPLPAARYYATGGDGYCYACYLGVGPTDIPEAYASN